MVAKSASEVQPERSTAYRVGQKVIAPPPQISGRPRKIVRIPKLRDQEVVIHYLLNNPGQWFVVERVDDPVAKSSALAMALYRRGCEVEKRATDNEHHLVFARWNHDIPHFPTGEDVLGVTNPEEASP
jgi:hypothetical protein